MKNLEDKLAASIKPARPKSSPKAKSSDAEVSKAAGEHQNTASKPAEQQSAASKTAEQQPAAEKKRPAPRQQAREKPAAARPDLNGQTQPLHPKRVWPD